ncbi:MAG TPA: phosphoenolpyruvate--protein phosphotransferase [Treponemataceae bacterium]|nr:phosphoenolpyruvate--protein phosphotransferase [Treponemataceae bacterium]
MNTRTISAVTLSRGAALGPALVYDDGEKIPAAEILPPERRESELVLLKSAVEGAVRELLVTAEKAAREIGAENAEIFEGHADIAGDEDFFLEMKAVVMEEGRCAEWAARTVSERNALEMEELDDEYLRERGEDFRDIGKRIASHVSSLRSGACREQGLYPPHPAVVCSETLSPAQTVCFHLPHVLGFVVSTGGSTSHAAILARSLSIPAVRVSPRDLASLKDGDTLILNLKKDELSVHPDAASQQDARALIEREREKRTALEALRDLPAQTLCGRRIGLYANAGSMKDLPLLGAVHPDGVGLFRTEFLFMEQLSLPDVPTQTAFYARVLETLSGRPVVFRLLDIGADKPLPYAPHPHESNPFLGWRGIRFLLGNPGILRGQLEALLLASASVGAEVRIMVPMVSNVSEMRAVRELLDEIIPRTGGRALLGMMVETPAAALTVRSYKGLSDFISIGSNDLTQYTLAADRENSLLSGLYAETHPAVLRLMASACRDARECGMETGICGEFASRPEGTILLAAMGFDELSVSPSAILETKALIRSLRLSAAQELLARVLELPDSASVAGETAAFISREALCV